MPTTYAIKDTFSGIVSCLRDYAPLSSFLTGVWNYYAYMEATVDPGKAAIYVEIEDSRNDQWVGFGTGAGTIETTYLITVDTVLPADSDLVETGQGGAATLIDLEHLTVEALGSKQFLGVAGRALTWQIDSIQRDAPVPGTDGAIDIDTPIRRTEIRIRVKSPVLLTTA